MLGRKCLLITHDQQGAVLLMLLVLVTVMGLMIGIAGSSWQTIVQRSKEQDLLWKGSQIRQAIGRYYEAAGTTGSVVRQFPGELDSLLLDPRFLQTTRYLRKLYPDPMTGLSWEPIQAPGGGIMGVRSTSLKRPFKRDNFNQQNSSFSGKQSYRDWEFVYRPVVDSPPKIAAPAIQKQAGAAQ